MQRSLAFALAACAILLFGCAATVPQTKYDDLSATCAQQKTDAAAALDAMTSKADVYMAQAGQCGSEQNATEKIISDQAVQISSLKNDSDVLADARQKSDLIAKYKQVQALFNDAYGPGKAPTTPKLKAIESLIISLKDSQLYGSWLDFSRCSIITECDNAKLRISEDVNSSVNTLTYQIADIVAKK